MIKGVGNAKDGAKDDQPTKPSTSYSSRPSMQGPVRAHTGLPGQGPLNQPSPLSQPPVGMGRSSTNESGPAEYQHAHADDGHKKPGGGFLGGLFNKQGSKPLDPRQQPNQSTPPAAQRPPQQPMHPGQQFRPGQMVPQGQPYGPHPIYPPGQSFNGGQPGQGVRRPTLQGQLSPQENIQSPTSPQFLGTAQAVMIRRPSEITVSSQNQAGPQTNMRPSTGEDVDARNPHRQFGGDGNYSVSGALPVNPPHLSHQLSHRPSQERFDVAGSSVATRTTPNRKPVGSGFSRQDGSPATTTKFGDSEPLSASAEDERRLSGQLPSGQQSPTLGKLGHVRQTSLPSPGRSPMPSQPGQVTSSPAVGGAQLSPRGLPSPGNRQVLGQPPGAPQVQPGVPQPGPGPTGYLSSSSGPSPLPDSRHPQTWNPISTFSNQQRPGPPNQNLQGQQPPRPLGKKTGPAQAPKESAASKFLNAFKRGNKQSEHSQAHEKQRPPPGHQIPPHAMRPPQPGGPQPGMARPPISGPSPAGPLGPMSNLPQGSMQPGQGRGGQMLPPPGPSDRGPLPPSMMYGVRPGQPPLHMQPGVSHKPQQILGLPPPASGQQRRSSTRLEPQYDHVPIPRGYEAVHGYGNAGTLAPSPYNVGRPSPPPAPQQFQPLAPQGVPQQQWDLRTAHVQQTTGPYGRPPIQISPNQQGLPQSIQRHTDSESTTPTPSEQGTFLDMTPTPPLRQSHEEPRTDRQLMQNVPSHASHGQLSQQAPVGTQINLQHAQDLDTQTPSSSNWGSAPDSARNPPSQGKQNPLAQRGIIRAKPSDPNISPPSDSGEVPRSQPQHIATAMSNNPLPPQVIPSESPNAARPFSPTSPPSRQLPGVPNISPPIVQGPEERPGSAAAAGRLVSKMSAANEPPKNASLSPDIVANRAASVSPEPPGPRSSPYHQVSNNSLNINVDRANDVRADAEEDIYDATPRMNSSQAQDPAHENTKYAGSERGRPVVNGTAIVGGGVVTAAAAAFAGAAAIDAAGVQDSGSEESTTPPLQQRQIPMNMEPEEKILVDQPVELAAVNDDDGVPAMSATSYPGQEWNPYAAGEFGDWE